MDSKKDSQEQYQIYYCKKCHGEFNDRLPNRNCIACSAKQSVVLKSHGKQPEINQLGTSYCLCCGNTNHAKSQCQQFFGIINGIAKQAITEGKTKFGSDCKQYLIENTYFDPNLICNHYYNSVGKYYTNESNKLVSAETIIFNRSNLEEMDNSEEIFLPQISDDNRMRQEQGQLPSMSSITNQLASETLDVLDSIINQLSKFQKNTKNILIIKTARDSFENNDISLEKLCQVVKQTLDELNEMHNNISDMSTQLGSWLKRFEYLLGTQNAQVEQLPLSYRY